MNTSEKVRQSVSTLGTVIQAGVDNRLKDLHTAQPGIIQSFDPVTQTASIQPAVKRIFKTDAGDGEAELLTPTALPVLINVPVNFPRGGGYSLTLPVKPGDECLLIFAERSFDRWHRSGKVEEPAARRFHHLSDATAFVGLSSLPKKIPDFNPDQMELKKDDGSTVVTLKQDELVAKVVTKITLDVPDLQMTGNLRVDGAISSGGDQVTDAGVSQNSHRHSGVDAGPSNTGPPA